MNPTKSELLVDTIEHIDIKKHNVVPLVEAMSKMAFSARDLARAADIYDAMLREEDCAIILCLAGSLISAGLKNVIVDLVRNNMVDAIVSTGAIIVDQDFFEALGFKHYKGDIFMNDDVLRRLAIDRIYDTYIDEDQLRVCDATCGEIADSLEPRPYSSREFIREMGRYLTRNGKHRQSGSDREAGVLSAALGVSGSRSSCVDSDPRSSRRRTARDHTELGVPPVKKAAPAEKGEWAGMR